MDNAEKAFRELREAWFNSVLKFRAHEREWEDEEHARRRESSNRRYKADYDAQTEGILRGESLPVAPHCWNDLTKIPVAERGDRT